MKPILRWIMMLPHLKRRTKMIADLYEKNIKFIQQILPARQPIRLDTLKGVDVGDLLRIFPTWPRTQAIPDSVAVYAVNYDPLQQRAEPWIYAANVNDPNQLPLAGLLSAADFFGKAEKQSQNLIYTVGFVVMFIGSAFSLIQIVL